MSNPGGSRDESEYPYYASEIVMKHSVDSLANQMGLHELEIAARKELFGLSMEDVYNLKKLREVFSINVDSIVERFYENQLENDDIALIIGDEETLRRLKQAQRYYIMSLTSGEYGTDYVNNRLRIGKVHKRIGVEPKHYMSSIKLMQSLLVEVVERELTNGKQEEVLRSLDRLLAFDIALVFETYTLSLTNEIENSRAKVEAYAHGLEEIIERRTQELAELSLKDPLTDLPNRRALKEFSRRQFANAIRYRECLSIVYLDIDRFKLLNDELGHDIGDKLLIILAGILTECVREGDIACRLGGDEFCIVIPQCDCDGARVFAERLVQAFVRRVDPSWNTSISLGTYTRAGDETSTEEACFRSADEAMYRAKEQRGNFLVQFDSRGAVAADSVDTGKVSEPSGGSSEPGAAPEVPRISDL